MSPWCLYQPGSTVKPRANACTEQRWPTTPNMLDVDFLLNIGAGAVGERIKRIKWEALIPNTFDDDCKNPTTYRLQQ